MTVSMTVIAILYSGEKLVLDNVDARLIGEIEQIIKDGECTELEIRNMDLPKKSIEFSLGNLRGIKFKNGS